MAATIDGRAARARGRGPHEAPHQVPENARGQGRGCQDLAQSPQAARVDGIIRSRDLNVLASPGQGLLLRTAEVVASAVQPGRAAPRRPPDAQQALHVQGWEPANDSCAGADAATQESVEDLPGVEGRARPRARQVRTHRSGGPFESTRQKDAAPPGVRVSADEQLPAHSGLHSSHPNRGILS